MIGRTAQRRTAALLVRGLVALALVPAVILAQTQVAAAATYYGGVSRVDVNACEGGTCLGGGIPGPIPGSVEGNELNCHISAALGQTDDIERFVRYSADCDRNAHLAFTDSSTPGGFTVSVWFKGTDSFYGACEMLGTFDGLDQGTTDTDESSTGCIVNEVCVEWVLDSWNSEVTGEGCSDFSLEEPDVPLSGTCERYNGVAAPVVTITTNSGNPTYQDVNVEGTLNRLFAGINEPEYIYFVRRTGGVVSIVSGVAALGAGSAYNPYSVPGPSLLDDTWELAMSASAPFDVIGVGIFPQDTPNESAWYQLPQNNANGIAGVNDPSRCLFYFGEKVADMPFSDLDEPLGPLGDGGGGGSEDPPDVGEPSEDPDEGCTFTLSDPGSWLEGGMCAAVGLLGQVVKMLGRVVSLLAGLPAALVDLIGDLLEDLLVPDDAPSFADVPSPLPSGWLPDFPSVSDGSCGPITLPSIDLGDMAGETGTMTLLDTCDEPWPDAREIVYYGLLALLLVGAMARAYSAVLTSLGINVDRSSSGGDDE